MNIALTDIEEKLYIPINKKYGIYKTEFESNLLKIPSNRLIHVISLIDIDLKQYTNCGNYVIFEDGLILINSLWKECSFIEKLIQDYIDSSSERQEKLSNYFYNLCKSEKRYNQIIGSVITRFIKNFQCVLSAEFKDRYEIECRQKYQPIVDIIDKIRYNYEWQPLLNYIVGNCDNTMTSTDYKCFIAGMIIGKRIERKRKQIADSQYKK